MLESRNQSRIKRLFCFHTIKRRCTPTEIPLPDTNSSRRAGSQPLGGLSTPGQGQGEGPTRYEFCEAGRSRLREGPEWSEAERSPARGWLPAWRQKFSGRVYSPMQNLELFSYQETDKFNALISLDKVHPQDRMVIVTYDEDRIHKIEDGREIEIIPVWKWLLR